MPTGFATVAVASALLVGLGLTGPPEIQLGGDRTAPAGVERPVGESRDAEAKVCRVISRTGSRVNPVRVCRTPEEWSEISVRTRKALESTQQRGAQGAQGAVALDRGAPGQ